MGDKTLPAVKERAVDFLEEAAGRKRKQYFPSEHSKILSVYQSLVDGGVIVSFNSFLKKYFLIFISLFFLEKSEIPIHRSR
jgi:hypothetical protein